MLQPHDPDSYYVDRELVPERHARGREAGQDRHHELSRLQAARARSSCRRAGGNSFKGRTGEELDTLETEGQMIQRVMPDLMGMKNIMVINDEAHHCYREKPDDGEEEDLKGDEKKEAEKNNEAARLWISGIEAVNRKLGSRASSICPPRRSSSAAQAMPRARCSPGR